MKYNVKRCVFSEIPTSNQAYDTVALYIYSAGSQKKKVFPLLLTSPNVSFWGGTELSEEKLHCF